MHLEFEQVWSGWKEWEEGPGWRKWLSVGLWHCPEFTVLPDQQAISHLFLRKLPNGLPHYESGNLGSHDHETMS